MVGVVVIEATQDNFANIVLVIAVGVLKEHQVSRLGNVDALGSDFKTHGDMQVAGEGGLLVGFAIVIGVFEDDELVAWLGVSDAVVRVAGHGGNPETSFVVECYLHRVGKVGEFFF